MFIFKIKNNFTTTWNQGVSQDLEIGCPNLIEISKQGVQIVHMYTVQYIYM